MEVEEEEPQKENTIVKRSFEQIKTNYAQNQNTFHTEYFSHAMGKLQRDQPVTQDLEISRG